MKNIKLMGMVEDIAVRERQESVNKFEVIEAVKNYQRIGGQLLRTMVLLRLLNNLLVLQNLLKTMC